MMEVAAAMMTIGVLDWVAMGAVASASGVRPKPASTSTLSFTTSSCASRLVTSGTPVSSFRTISIWRPATLSPNCAMYRRTPFSIWRPVEPNWPVMGNNRPILNGVPCWAAAMPVPTLNALAAIPCRNTLLRMLMGVSVKKWTMVDLELVDWWQAGWDAIALAASADQPHARQGLHVMAAHGLAQIALGNTRMLAHHAFGA